MPPVDATSRTLDTPSRTLDTPSRTLDTPSRTLETRCRTLEAPCWNWEKATKRVLQENSREKHREEKIPAKFNLFVSITPSQAIYVIKIVIVILYLLFIGS
jgi:hypothetical protein